MKPNLRLAAGLSALLAALPAYRLVADDEKTKAPVKDEPTKADPGRRELLETVGALSAAHLYQTYINIGVIADAKAEELYEEKQARELLGTLDTLMDTVDRNLAKVAAGKLDKDDRESLQSIRKTAALLRRASTELRDAWAGKDRTAAAKYEKSRKEAWTAIAELLELER